MPPVPSRTLKLTIGALIALSALTWGGYRFRATQGAAEPANTAVSPENAGPTKESAPGAGAATAETAATSLQNAPPPSQQANASRGSDGSGNPGSEAGKAQPLLPAPPPSADKPLAARTIIVDPGHGGSPSNGGATGVSGLKEKEFNLALGFQLQAALSDAGAKVIMTRVTDLSPVIPSRPELDQLDARTYIAARSGADLFISLHANWSPDPSISGMETYYYPGSAAGQRLAQTMLREVAGRTGIEPRFADSAEFAVLHNHPVPAVLIEFGYMSNTRDEARLRDPAARVKMVRGVVAGATSYLGR